MLRLSLKVDYLINKEKIDYNEKGECCDGEDYQRMQTNFIGQSVKKQKKLLKKQSMEIDENKFLKSARKLTANRRLTAMTKEQTPSKKQESDDFVDIRKQDSDSLADIHNLIDEQDT